jgi:hypothetical protein
MQRMMFGDVLPASVGGIGDRDTPILEPITRMIMHLGGDRNPTNLLATQRQINTMKGRIMGFDSPISEDNFRNRLSTAATGLSPTNRDYIMTAFRNVSLSLSHMFKG